MEIKVNVVVFKLTHTREKNQEEFFKQFRWQKEVFTYQLAEEQDTIEYQIMKQLPSHDFHHQRPQVYVPNIK